MEELLLLQVVWCSWEVSKVLLRGTSKLRLWRCGWMEETMLRLVWCSREVSEVLLRSVLIERMFIVPEGVLIDRLFIVPKAVLIDRLFIVSEGVLVVGHGLWNTTS